jgi:hypothetical protein
MEWADNSADPKLHILLMEIRALIESEKELKALIRRLIDRPYNAK